MKRTPRTLALLASLAGALALFAAWPAAGQSVLPQPVSGRVAPQNVDAGTLNRPEPAAQERGTRRMEVAIFPPSSGLDGGGAVSTTEAPCSASAESVCLIDDKSDGGTVCPAAQLAQRRYLTLCSKTQNVAGGIVAVSINGVPSVGKGGGGTALAVDRCVTFYESSAKTPHLISNFAADAAVAVSAYECAHP